MSQLRDVLDLEVRTVGPESMRDVLDRAGRAAVPGGAIRRRDAPVHPQGGLAVLSGNLAPDGALIKQSAASAPLVQHEGRAVVFDSVEDLAARIDLPDLDVAADDVLVLRNAGPRGGQGMPEAGYLPIPGRLARQGVKDMVRISDARMSGTGFGTIVLHVAPEAAVGGPLGLVRSGDRIRLDLAARRLDVCLSDAELDERRAAWSPVRQEARRGYARLFDRTVTQADKGCDFDFLGDDNS
jgi:dihydroxy-acid dehydratase